MLDLLPSDFAAAAQLAGSLCQMTTAIVAVTLAVVTFRYTRRQNALALINQNNALANAVNTAIIQSPEARQALGMLQEPIVGCPDDAVLFMYLNYVHNTFRTHQIGAVGPQVWTDTLASCATMMSRLTRTQVERLLARGYEAQFTRDVLARFDLLAGQADMSNVSVLPQRRAA